MSGRRTLTKPESRPEQRSADFATSSLPLLPGMNFSDPFHTKSSFSRSHVFDYKGGSPVILPPGVGGGLDNEVPMPATPGIFHSGPLTETDDPRKRRPQPVVEQPVPTFAALDRKVLRFYAYFKESVFESSLETQRVRKVVLYYYLEDETIHVSEPRSQNSGIVQGPFIKRHQVPKEPAQLIEVAPGVTRPAHYTHVDLNVGTEIGLYGKVFYLVDCDEFTRQYLESDGIPVPPKEDYPGDDYSSTRTRQDSVSPVKGRSMQAFEQKRYLDYSVYGRHCKPTPFEVESTQSYLNNDKKVIRFYGLWDDRAKMFGDVHHLVVCYFLSDGAMEMSERYPTNSGRDPFPTFLKHRKVMKKPKIEFDNTTHKLGPAEPEEVYTDADLHIGAILEIYDRSILLYDCDDFTKSYYREKYGITDFTPIDVTEEKTPLPKAPVPPHNGWGSEEDSLGSVLHLVLKPPKKDLRKFLDYDREILRWSAVLDTTVPEDMGRQFTVSWFMADDTLSIYEISLKNSGIIGGKFLSRQKVKKDGTDRYLELTDIVVGTNIKLAGHTFRITAVEDHASSTMEKERTRVIPTAADLETLLRRVHSLSMRRGLNMHSVFQSVDSARTGLVAAKDFKRLLLDCQLGLSDTEIKTLSTTFDLHRDNIVDWQEFLAALERVPSDVATASRGRERRDFLEFTLNAFRQNLLSNRDLYDQLFRVFATLEKDGHIEKAEFVNVVNRILHMGFSDDEMQALVDQVFAGRSKMATKELRDLVDNF